MNQGTRGILFCLSGNQNRLADSLRRHAKLQGVDIREINEKDITRPRCVLNPLRDDAANCVAFGCKSLSLQRFQFFLKLYLLLSWKPDRYFVDEEGVVVKVSWLSFVFFDLPRFLLELAASLWIIISATIVLPIKLAFWRRRT